MQGCSKDSMDPLRSGGMQLRQKRNQSCSLFFQILRFVCVCVWLFVLVFDVLWQETTTFKIFIYI